MSDAGETALSDETPSSSLTVKEAYDIFSSQINKEDALIASRMAWGLTLNGAAITGFGSLCVLLNSQQVNLTPLAGDCILLFAMVFLLLFSFDIYYSTIESIWDARKQIYHIRKSYHKYWGNKIESQHLPRPYGSRLPHGEHNYQEPEFFKFPTIVLRKWMPFSGTIHGMKIGRYELIHPLKYTGKLRERRWWAEHILFASLLTTWGVLLLLVITGVTSEIYKKNQKQYSISSINPASSEHIAQINNPGCEP